VATFDFIDKDSDGQITEEEFLEAFIPPEGPGAKGGVDANELSQELRNSLTADFARLDQNGDEHLSLEEFLAGNPNQQGFEELVKLLTDDFNYRDGDDNGTLSLDEYLALVLPEGPIDAFLSQDRNRDGFIERGEIAVIFLGAPDEMIDDFLSFHDADGDGRISREEFEDRRANNNFASFDLDNDGFLSREEFQEATIGEKEAVDKAFATLDGDEDGRISKKEFEDPGHHVQDEEFNERDENGDGVISREEVVAFFGADDPIVDDIMSTNDANGDGVIERDEWVGGF
jgi:Ca2+-binding EF-hand superfamily protein